MAQSADRVDIAQGLKPLLGRLRRQASLTCIEPGDSGQQRSVEELLVNSANLTGMATPGLHELGHWFASEPHRAPEPAQILLIVRHGVSAAETMQLDSVLQSAQELVGVRECVRIIAAYVTPRR